MKNFFKNLALALSILVFSATMAWGATAGYVLFSADGGVRMPETATPTAESSVGQVYTKSDNVLYFQDGAGVEIPPSGREQQRVRVCKSGCAYDVIQDAIDSITDASASKRYVIEIYSGTYTENVVLGDYMVLEGRGDGMVIITSSSGTTLTMPSSGSFVDHLRIISTPTASGAIAVDVTAGGVHIFEFSAIELTSASNGITGTLVDIGGSSDVTFVDMDFLYTMTGSAVGSNNHNIINQADSSVLNLFRSNVFTTVGDVDDNVNVLCDNSTGNTIIVSANWTTFITNASYSGIATTWEHLKTSVVHLDQYSLANMIGAGSGTAQIIKLDTDTNDGTIDAGYNTAVAVNFGTSWHINVGTGDTVNSAFDLNTGGLETTGDGVVNHFGSSANGQLDILSPLSVVIDATNEWHAIGGMTVGISDDNVDLMAGESGAITAFADAGGGQVTVTASNTLLDGEYITITGTAYDDIYEVTNTTSTNFEITAVFGATDTGFYDHGSYLKVKQRGFYTVVWSFSMESLGNNKNFVFSSFKNDAQIAGSGRPRDFGSTSSIGIGNGSSKVFLEKDDVVWFGLKNTTDDVNMNLNEGAQHITKSS